MTWLLYLFAAYLGACYLWAMYLVVRLYTGKRLRVLLRGRRDIRPAATTHATPAPAYTTTAAAASSSTSATTAAPSRKAAA